MNNQKVAVLFVTHIWNTVIEQRYILLRDALNSSIYDLIVLIQQDSEYSIKDFFSMKYRYYPFTKQCLTSLGYSPIFNSIVPGSNHFPVLQFYRDFPNYEFYWNIEYDVFFNGDWTSFFQYYEGSQIDFLTSQIQSYKENPFWPWWGSFSSKVKVPLAKRLRSFNPIYRISNRALDLVDKCLIMSVSGHHEVLLPTLLFNKKFSLQDFGKNKTFGIVGHEPFYYSGESYSVHYQTSSMRYRPCIEAYEIVHRDILYHPFK